MIYFIYSLRTCIYIYKYPSPSVKIYPVVPPLHPPPHPQGTGAPGASRSAAPARLRRPRRPDAFACRAARGGGGAE